MARAISEAPVTRVILSSGDGEIAASGALTDKSGTITTGGAAQVAAAANTARRYLYIENPYTATETLWFSTVATAVADSPSIALQPGDTWENPPHFCPTGALSVIAATTGHKWTAMEV